MSLMILVFHSLMWPGRVIALFLLLQDCDDSGDTAISSVLVCCRQTILGSVR